MFTKTASIASLLALAVASVPAAASPRGAAFDSSSDRQQNRAFLFAGPTVRLNLDRPGQPRPEVALRFAGATRVAGMAPRIGEGIALTAAGPGKARLTIHGQDSKQVAQRLGMSDAGKTALIVGGLVLVLGAALLLAADDAVDDINEDCCGSIND